MKFIFGLVAALCIVGVFCDETETKTDVKTDAAEKICEPGAVSEVNCNTCICNNAGTELACTKKVCVGEKEGEVKPETLPATDAEGEVKPQTLPVPEADLEVKPQTLPAEIPAVAKDRRRRRRDTDEETCEPGKTFKKDCNDCECPSSGRKSEAQICTTIAC